MLTLGHFGLPYIRGNEKADAAAKAGLSRRVTELFQFLMVILKNTSMSF